LSLPSVSAGLVADKTPGQ